MNCVLSYIQFLDQCIAKVQVPAKKKSDLRVRLPGLVPIAEARVRLPGLVTKAEAAAEKIGG